MGMTRRDQRWLERSRKWLAPLTNIQYKADLFLLSESKHHQVHKRLSSEHPASTLPSHNSPTIHPSRNEMMSPSKHDEWGRENLSLLQDHPDPEAQLTTSIRNPSTSYENQDPPPYHDTKMSELNNIPPAAQDAQAQTVPSTVPAMPDTDPTAVRFQPPGLSGMQQLYADEVDGLRATNSRLRFELAELRIELNRSFGGRAYTRLLETIVTILVCLLVSVGVFLLWKSKAGTN